MYRSTYRRIQKQFFRAVKTKDAIAYIKLKHQFQTMLTLAVLALSATLFMLIAYRIFLTLSIPLLLVLLITIKTQSYKIAQTFFLVITTVIPARYLSNHLVLVAPVGIVACNFQSMTLDQPDSHMAAQLVVQAIGFYFYGFNCITAKLKEMSNEEIIESARITIGYAFMWSVVNLILTKVFRGQFSSVLKKVNKLRDGLAKANEDLNKQNLKLQGNLEMKDVFIYTFSHELKNALNGLLGNLTLACETAKDSQVLQFLFSAKVCGEVLKNFVHNILDTGKLENKNLEVSSEKKDVMNFMQNVWAVCGRIIQNKRLQGYLDIEKNVPRYLELDEQRVLQIILNLVSNAVKFTEKGNVRLHISWQTKSTSSSHSTGGGVFTEIQSQTALNENGKEIEETTIFRYMQEFPEPSEFSPSRKENQHLETEQQKKFITDSQFYQLNLAKWQWKNGECLSSKLSEGSKGILKIQVIDTGCGMTSEDQALLFQKFSQVNPVPGQRKVGTGLGLWISKELAKRLDGDIKTRSMVGVGSVFELSTLTKVSNAAPENSYNRHTTVKKVNSLPKRAVFEFQLQQQRSPNLTKVLIADDDGFNIELMKNYLSKLGISSLIAYDGEEAVTLFKRYYQDIGFVITDNFMPKKLGTEAAVEIADFLEEMRRPQIPILCISGDVKVNVGEKGITNVLQKPVNFDRLKKELAVIYPQVTG